MAYCRNCDVNLKEQNTEVIRGNKKITYHITYCEICGKEYHRRTVREENINIPARHDPSTDNPRPKDPKWDKQW
jgi:RNase P subunit RPR2